MSVLSIFPRFFSRSAKNNISSVVEHDYRRYNKDVEDIISVWKKSVDPQNRFYVAYVIFDSTLFIITDRPGLMIGLQGNIVNRYQEMLTEYGINIVKFIELKKHRITRINH